MKALVVLLGALIGGITVANAATDSTTFAVKITITETCAIDAASPTDVTFASTVRSASVGEATGTLTVNCSTGTPYSIALDDGLSAASGSRRMALGGNFIAYGLYQSTGTGTPWTTAAPRTGTGSGSNQVLTVYGTVSGSTNVPAGNYTDTVTATLTY